MLQFGQHKYSNSGQNQEHLCLQNYRMNSNTLKQVVYIYALVGGMKEGGFLHRVDFY